MSGANSIAPGVVEAEAERAPFAIPEALSTRYDVRIVDGSGEDERRLGLFSPRNHLEPAIEITGSRIIARDDDPETIASIVKLAEHNNWNRLEVEGSPAFRKAVWAEATRAGLTVGGYEPSFADAERLQQQRRDEIEARARQSAASKAPTTTDAVVDAERAAEVIAAAKRALAERASPQPDGSIAAARPAGSDDLRAQGDSRLNDRAAVEQLFERGIRALEAQGDPRATAVRETAAALVDQMYGEQEEHAVAQSTSSRDRQANSDHREDAGRSRVEAEERDRGSEELAELFLHGAAERIASDPRLSNALRAQSDMERHIAEVFPGAPDQAAAATLQSRELISDVLRRGLDVSARAPSPVRQIEPLQSPELER